jgi:Tfp pilus assembly protein PilE
VEESERGSTLVEVIVSLAISAIIAAAALSAVLAAIHHLAPDPVQSRLRDLASSELAIAVNLVKYQGSVLTPASVATAIPMPAGSPLPVELRLDTQNAAAGAATLTVTASAGALNESATVTATVGSRAPLPGARIDAPGLVPAPTGAP